MPSAFSHLFPAPSWGMDPQRASAMLFVFSPPNWGIDPPALSMPSCLLLPLAILSKPCSYHSSPSLIRFSVVVFLDLYFCYPVCSSSTFCYAIAINFIAMLV